jgi:hypothetical protein
MALTRPRVRVISETTPTGARRQDLKPKLPVGVISVIVV